MEARDLVVIDFDSGEPFDLRELTAAFQGISWHFRRSLERRGYSQAQAASVKLYVTRLETGSLTAELALGAAVLGYAFQAMDYTVVVADFMERVRSLLAYFTGRSETPPEDMNAAEIRALSDFIRPVAKSANGRLGVKWLKIESVEETRERKRRVVLTMSDDASDLARAQLRMSEIEELLKAQNDEHPRRYEHVLMYLHQASRDPGRPPGKRTGDRAVVEEVTRRPLPVHFVPGAEELKNEMVAREENPFRLGFIVDVDVQTKHGKPALYVVRKIHDVVELDDEDGGADPNRTSSGLTPEGETNPRDL